MDKFWPIAYALGNIFTFAILTYEDAGHVHGFMKWVVVLALNEAIAMVWPVYWAVLRWIF